MTTLEPALDLHPALRSTTDPSLSLFTGLLHPERPQWTPRELRDLTWTVVAELSGRLHELAEYVPEQRWWARLALTEGVELWLLTWLPGQQTSPHDHGGAAGSFTVLSGELTEQYRYPGGPVRDLKHTLGNAIGFGAGRAHQLGNASTATEPSASVHAYSPPLTPTREYASLLDVPAEIPALIPEQVAR